jgi:hypothetical protein
MLLFRIIIAFIDINVHTIILYCFSFLLQTHYMHQVTGTFEVCFVIIRCMYPISGFVFLGFIRSFLHLICITGVDVVITLMLNS